MTRATEKSLRLRLPNELHLQLKRMAESREISLNLLMVKILSAGAEGGYVSAAARFADSPDEDELKQNRKSYSKASRTGSGTNGKGGGVVTPEELEDSEEPTDPDADDDEPEPDTEPGNGVSSAGTEGGEAG